MATEEHGSGLQIHPMDQFVVKPLFGDGPVHWYTPTNVTLWMGIAVLAMIALLVLSTRRGARVPSRGQSVAELFYGFIHKMVEDVAGHEGLKFFPYIMTLFMFVFLSNMLGLIPMSFTTTSHIAVTAVLALLVFLTVTLVGLYRKGVGFLAMFWVTSAPLALRPILAVIEVVSYFVRPVSHSVRLGGNLLAGHAVIKVFAGFAGAMGVASVVPIAAIVAMYGLEVLVAAVQAYVFTILTCVYLRDAVDEAHH
ncbi:F0F1 ATP synthase subunit A [Rhodobacter calidifons]|uniref:ATP synthase subunit a n=1 Tax=Rhodobacter calidifons TaxID=2715277 RepID=A0ABX0GB23_9RHOB|nr:F0F1 ATP synthase subunit A [Rhodobacter calidifons]NHB78088.1 F0F1 ATP synthase subunit A [Rhodobacter calidifons]